jgi:hypothetical protein
VVKDKTASKVFPFFLPQTEQLETFCVAVEGDGELSDFEGPLGRQW